MRRGAGALRAAGCGLLLTLAGCAALRPGAAGGPVPMERWAPVVTAEAPVINQIKPVRRVYLTLRAGELVQLVHAEGPHAWSESKEPGALRREGELFQVRRSAEHALAFAFAADLGPEVDSPAAGWLCRQAAPAPAGFDPAVCEGRLQRLQVAGGLAAFAPCASGPCPVLTLRGGAVAAAWLENLAIGRPALGRRPLLLAETRWSSDEGRRSGGVLELVDLTGAPRVVQRIPLDEVDARELSAIRSRSATVEERPDRLVVSRTERVVWADGTERSSASSVDEYQLGAW